MSQALLILAAVLSFAQQSTQPQPAAAPSQPAQTQSADQPAQPPAQPVPAQASAPAASKGCMAVKPIGSHAFRNIMLAGVAGALISKQQYQVVDVKDYPARVGQKFHGDDLQTITTTGTKVVILDKHYTPEDLHKACQ